VFFTHIVFNHQEMSRIEVRSTGYSSKRISKNIIINNFFGILRKYRCRRYFQQKVSVSILVIILSNIVNKPEHYEILSCTGPCLLCCVCF